MDFMGKVKKGARRAGAAMCCCAAALGLAACGSSSSGSSGKHLTLVAYSAPQGVYEKLIPAFEATPEGAGITFSQSYGGSGAQARAVLNGLHADVVNFSLEPDVEKIVNAGLVSADWNFNAT